MRQPKRFSGSPIPAAGLFCLLLLTACNAFDWTYSAESSTDFGLVMAEAEACFRSADYHRALALYSRAVSLQSNASFARYGRIRCRLLIAADPHPVAHRFAELLETAGSTNRLFAGEPQLALAGRLASFRLGMADLRLIADGAGSGSFDTNATAFLADGALLAALHGCLTLADGDGDGIPFSTRDRIMIDRRFHLLLLEPGAEDPTNDLRPILEDTLLAWETGMALLRRLFSRDPAWDRQGSTFRKLYTNLVTLRSNTTAILQTLEAGP